MDENIGKRNRGRPKGTGRHQKQKLDAMVLEKLADRKLADPSAKTAVIIKQLIDRTKDTGGLRRLERGFEKNKPALMAAALARQQAERNAVLVENFASALRFIEGLRNEFEAFARSPKGQEVWEKANRFAKGVAEIMASPQLRPWLELAHDPTKVSSKTAQVGVTTRFVQNRVSRP
jgi:hypothetical protein